MEQHVIAKFFGLDNGEPQNLTEIGLEYGITRERVRQIKEAALRKLRDPKSIRKLIYNEAAASTEEAAAKHNNNNNNNTNSNTSNT